MMKALVYCGPGAGSRSVGSAVEALQRQVQPHVQVKTVDARDIVESDEWHRNALVLVMPGGADVPYCRKLNGRGNDSIRSYVENGGSYLGLCAGAYYGCSRVEFEVEDPVLEVQGERELGFFEGSGRGSVYPGFEYESEKGAVAAPVRFVSRDGVPCDGRVTAGEGRIATTVTAGEGRIATATMTTREVGLKTGGAWNTCKDYVNGGPYFVNRRGQIVKIHTILDENTEVLATYPEKDHAASALYCKVGLGCAVLCSSHPEMDHSWLQGSIDAMRDRLDAKKSLRHGDLDHDERYIRHVTDLRNALEEHAPGRQALWTTLLTACGMAPHLVAPCMVSETPPAIRRHKETEKTT